MSPILTTITPYWDRPDALRVWLKALEGCHDIRVNHLVFVVGEQSFCVAKEFSDKINLEMVSLPEDKPGHFSIGHYHNLGAVRADSEWIMKLDLDAIPNVQYFAELLPILLGAGPREWFNGGMIYCNHQSSAVNLTEEKMPLAEKTYEQIMGNRATHATGYELPGSSNFICRKEDYIALDGCDERFRGWGWEDYQQLYMLEAYQRGADPLPGPVTIENVTRRCRDEISRPKALELWKRNEWLCLLHRFHGGSSAGYRNRSTVDANRRILLERILQWKGSQ